MAKKAEPRSEVDEARELVASYVAVGADESVQRVITAVRRVSRRLSQWYDQQLADLDISTGEWDVLHVLAQSGGVGSTPSQLAEAAHVAPSSMTHRLDRMESRNLISRRIDTSNRTRIQVQMADAGWQLYVSAIRESSVVEADIMAGLTARQVENLAGLLEKLLAGLDSTQL